MNEIVLIMISPTITTLAVIVAIVLDQKWLKRLGTSIGRLESSLDGAFDSLGF